MIEDIRSYYNEKSKNYDNTFDKLYYKVYDAVIWKYLEPHVPTSSNALVLDVGGGTGRWSIRMAEKGCKVVLLDASKGMLEIATAKVKQKGFQDRIIVKEGEITKMAYADETFDMAFCEHTLFLFREPDILLRELQRVLKKKARLLISAQNLYVQCLVSLSENPKHTNVDDALKILLRKKYNTMTKEGIIKIHTWTPDEFQAMLNRNGFFVEKIVGNGITMPLRISQDTFMKNNYSTELLKKILEFEFAICEKPDALALAGHLLAITYKKS